MGSIMGKAMEENFNKTVDFQLKMQQLMMERQLAMQNQMRERQMAMMISRSRDMFMYFFTFYNLAAVACVAGFMKSKTPGPLVPLLPLTTVAIYQWDMAYGPKMKRMREMADRILDEEKDLLELPHGMPTFASIESARLKAKAEEPYKAGHDIFL